MFAARPDHPGIPYRIIVRGRLTNRLEAAFDGMAIEPGDHTSAIVGQIVDQAQLLGLIELVAGLGLDLVSVTPAQLDHLCSPG